MKKSDMLGREARVADRVNDRLASDRELALLLRVDRAIPVAVTRLERLY